MENTGKNEIMISPVSLVFPVVRFSFVFFVVNPQNRSWAEKE
jgi:hypothetical protein